MAQIRTLNMHHIICENRILKKFTEPLKYLFNNIMQGNYSQRLEMQIPQENAFTGQEIMPKKNIIIEKFLKKHFKFPSRNSDEISQFIVSDKEMEKLIRDLPEVLSKELPYCKLTLDFMKETDPNEKILEIVIYSDLESNRLLQKEGLLCDMLIDRYPKTTSEYIILVETKISKYGRL